MSYEATHVGSTKKYKTMEANGLLKVAKAPLRSAVNFKFCTITPLPQLKILIESVYSLCSKEQILISREKGRKIPRVVMFPDLLLPELD